MPNVSLGMQYDLLDGVPSALALSRAAVDDAAIVLVSLCYSFRFTGIGDCFIVVSRSVCT